jgi:uncharacterized membrane protein YidH (DUF202 family)
MASNEELLRKTAEHESDPRVDLAVERTELALERTQLSWIRLSLALLGSGVALDKGIEAVHEARIESGDALVRNAHMIGIYLSVAGTMLMIINTWRFVRRSRSLAQMKKSKPMWIPPGAAASLVVILLGIVVSLLLWAA